MIMRASCRGIIRRSRAGRDERNDFYPAFAFFFACRLGTGILIARILAREIQGAWITRVVSPSYVARAQFVEIARDVHDF